MDHATSPTWPDDHDRALIRELQRDGRASIQTLADRIGMARSSVSARLRHLTESGAVRVVGIIHSGVIGLNTVAHVSVVARGTTARIVDALAKRKTTSFVSTTASRHAVVAEIRTRSALELQDELELIRTMDEVGGIDVFNRISVVKDVYATAGQPEPIKLDDLDTAILGELQRDGRSSYSRISELVGLSRNATRARVNRLLDSGTVHVSALVNSAALGYHEHAGLGLRVSGPAHEIAAKVADLPESVYVLTGSGWFDVLVAIVASDSAALATLIDKVRDLNRDGDVHGWNHLRIHKEIYDIDLADFLI